MGCTCEWMEQRHNRALQIEAVFTCTTPGLNKQTTQNVCTSIHIIYIYIRTYVHMYGILCKASASKAQRQTMPSTWSSSVWVAPAPKHRLALAKPRSLRLSASYSPADASNGTLKHVSGNGAYLIRPLAACHLSNELWALSPAIWPGAEAKRAHLSAFMTSSSPIFAKFTSSPPKNVFIPFQCEMRNSKFYRNNNTNHTQYAIWQRCFMGFILQVHCCRAELRRCRHCCFCHVVAA